MSRLASEQGDYVWAKEAAEEGLTRSKEAGTQDGRRPFFVRNTPAPFLLNQLANVSLHKGDYERARELGEESLALGRQADDARSIVLSLIILAIAATLRADYEQAEKPNAEGMSLARELQSAYTRFLCLQNWGVDGLASRRPRTSHPPHRGGGGAGPRAEAGVYGLALETTQQLGVGGALGG